MTLADIGYGAVFGIESATPGTYTAVAEVTSITIPSRSRDAIEATHLGSANAYKQFIAGLKDGGECTLGLNFVAGATAVMVAAFEAEKGKYRIIAPDGVNTIIFEGFFTEYSPPELAPGDLMTATATIKLSGMATLGTIA